MFLIEKLLFLIENFLELPQITLKKVKNCVGHNIISVVHYGNLKIPI